MGTLRTILQESSALKHLKGTFLTDVNLLQDTKTQSSLSLLDCKVQDVDLRNQLDVQAKVLSQKRQDVLNKVQNADEWKDHYTLPDKGDARHDELEKISTRKKAGAKLLDKLVFIIDRGGPYNCGTGEDWLTMRGDLGMNVSISLMNGSYEYKEVEGMKGSLQFVEGGTGASRSYRNCTPEITTKFMVTSDRYNDPYMMNLDHLGVLVDQFWFYPSALVALVFHGILSDMERQPEENGRGLGQSCAHKQVLSMLDDILVNTAYNWTHMGSFPGFTESLRAQEWSARAITRLANRNVHSERMWGRLLTVGSRAGLTHGMRTLDKKERVTFINLKNMRILTDTVDEVQNELFTNGVNVGDKCISYFKEIEQGTKKKNSITYYIKNTNGQFFKNKKGTYLPDVIQPHIVQDAGNKNQYVVDETLEKYTRAVGTKLKELEPSVQKLVFIAEKYENSVLIFLNINSKLPEEREGQIEQTLEQEPVAATADPTCFPSASISLILGADETQQEEENEIEENYQASRYDTFRYIEEGFREPYDFMIMVTGLIDHCIKTVGMFELSSTSDMAPCNLEDVKDNKKESVLRELKWKSDQEKVKEANQHVEEEREKLQEKLQEYNTIIKIFLDHCYVEKENRNKLDIAARLEHRLVELVEQNIPIQGKQECLDLHIEMDKQWDLLLENEEIITDKKTAIKRGQMRIVLKKQQLSMISGDDAKKPLQSDIKKITQSNADYSEEVDVIQEANLQCKKRIEECKNQMDEFSPEMNIWANAIIVKSRLQIVVEKIQEKRKTISFETKTHMDEIFKKLRWNEKSKKKEINNIKNDIEKNTAILGDYEKQLRKHKEMDQETIKKLMKLKAEKDKKKQKQQMQQMGIDTVEQLSAKVLQLENISYDMEKQFIERRKDMIARQTLEKTAMENELEAIQTENNKTYPILLFDQQRKMENMYDVLQKIQDRIDYLHCDKEKELLETDIAKSLLELERPKKQQVSSDMLSSLPKKGGNFQGFFSQEEQSQDHLFSPFSLEHFDGEEFIEEEFIEEKEFVEEEFVGEEDQKEQLEQQCSDSHFMQTTATIMGSENQDNGQKNSRVGIPGSVWNIKNGAHKVHFRVFGKEEQFNKEFVQPGQPIPIFSDHGEHTVRTNKMFLTVCTLNSLAASYNEGYNTSCHNEKMMSMMRTYFSRDMKLTQASTSNVKPNEIDFPPRFPINEICIVKGSESTEHESQKMLTLQSKISPKDRRFSLAVVTLASKVHPDKVYTHVALISSTPPVETTRNQYNYQDKNKSKKSQEETEGKFQELHHICFLVVWFSGLILQSVFLSSDSLGLYHMATLVKLGRAAVKGYAQKLYKTGVLTVFPNIVEEDVMFQTYDAVEVDTNTHFCWCENVNVVSKDQSYTSTGYAKLFDEQKLQIGMYIYGSDISNVPAINVNTVKNFEIEPTYMKTIDRSFESTTKDDDKIASDQWKNVLETLENKLRATYKNKKKFALIQETMPHFSTMFDRSKSNLFDASLPMTVSPVERRAINKDKAHYKWETAFIYKDLQEKLEGMLNINPKSKGKKK